MLVHRYPALIPDSQPKAAHTPPRNFWQRLLTQPRLAPGASVLVVGQNALDLAAFLVDLAYDVTGLCDSADAVIAGRRHCPKADFVWCNPQTRVEMPSCRFDLILIDDPLAYEANLFDLQARQFTAHLLATLKPLGRLVTFRRVHQAGRHPIDCWPRHLACFPGEVTQDTVYDSLLSRSTWNWLVGREPRAATEMVTLMAPLEFISREEWREFARRGLLTGRRVCCPQVAQISTPQPSPSRRAA